MTIKFGGRVEGFEENGRTFYRTVDTQDILAVPYDIPVVGYAGETVNKLRSRSTSIWRPSTAATTPWQMPSAPRPRPSAPSSTPMTPASTAVCCA